SRLRDQRPRPLDVRLTRKLDDDSLGAYSLHVLLARARRIQAVAQDVDIAVDVLPLDLGGHGAIRVIDLEGEIDTAAQIEPARDAARVEGRDTRDHDYGNDQEPAFERAEHR